MTTQRFPDPEVPGAFLRQATPKDNEALLDIFSDIPMRGQLVLTTERAPHFFALYDIQGAEIECWVYEKDGHILGLGTIVSRPGWIAGKPCKVAYLGDLRARREARGIFVRFFGRAFLDFQERTGCEHVYTGIIASNQRAINALVERGPHRESQPRYELLRRYNTLQVQFQRRPRRHDPSPYRVRTATSSDLPAIQKMLAEDHQNRPFGYRYDQGEFTHRLANWPEFSLDQTYLVTRGDELCGLCTAWDAERLKRYRILQYRGKMRAIRALFNAGARIMKYTPLPPPGECFRYFYLANLSIPSRDPAILRAMISSIYKDFFGKNYHFFMIYMEENDPLEAATKGFSVRKLPFHLYTVHQPNGPTPDYSKSTSGLEISMT